MHNYRELYHHNKQQLNYEWSNDALYRQLESHVLVSRLICKYLTYNENIYLFYIETRSISTCDSVIIELSDSTADLKEYLTSNKNLIPDISELDHGKFDFKQSNIWPPNSFCIPGI